jgi:DNA-directed RNA polymerase specialized sigma24 family protein
MISVERGLEGKTKTLSGCLYFYFTKRLLDYIRKLPRIPVPITAVVNDPETNTEDQLDRLLDEGEGHQWVHPDHDIRAREIMEHYQNLLETLPTFQKDAMKLNVNGFSHQDIADFLSAPKQKVTKQKFNARQKFREVLHKEE